MVTRVLIAGPTASGKSALAVQIARDIGGIVINADSQQIYRDWQVLTARPGPEEMGGIEHHLYGHVGLDQNYSVGHWLEDVRPLLDRPCVFVGGTGLYFKSLTEGLAEIPPVDPAVRADAERVLGSEGLEALVARLSAEDPATAAKIDLVNPRRVVRAWEVLQATGTGLAAWQAATPAPLLRLDDCRTVALTPDREWLYARCEARFDRMIAEGALDEARAVMAQGLPPEAPGLKALGAPELFAHLAGEMPLEDAIAQAKTETRRYAKRQMTWIRNQMDAWETHDPSAAAE
ncbi:MAG: tRNA (adenosine(37)-N6)-dimethylallyltransferase MiaA [Pseudomonadota bacterium]